MKKTIILISLIIFVFNPQKVISIQTSYQISPPPIPWYEFSKGQEDLKISATALSITGKVDSPEDPEAGGDVSVYGGAGGAFYRYAFMDKFAIDAGGTASWSGGDVGNSATMNMGMLYIPVGLEYMAMKTENAAIIIFGGMNFSWLGLGININTGTDSGTVEMVTSTRGPQCGIQAALKFTDFVFTPFLMATRLSGAATINYEGDGDSGQTSTGIPAATSMTYGLDIVYVPIDLTLSFIIQQGLSNDDNNGLQTHIFTLSYHFDLTDNNDEEIEPVNTKQAQQGKQKAKTGVK